MIGFAIFDGIAKPMPMLPPVREDCRVHAHQAAFHVDERPARVSGIDGRVGLDEVLVVGDAHVRAPLGGNDAHRNGLTDAEGITDSEHDVAEPQARRVTELDGPQALDLPLKPQNRKIALRIHADHFGDVIVFIRRRDVDLVCLVNDVIVRQHNAVSADDDAGAQALKLAISPATLRVGARSHWTEKAPEHWVIEEGHLPRHRFDDTRRGYIHDARRRALGNIGNGDRVPRFGVSKRRMGQKALG